MLGVSKTFLSPFISSSRGRARGKRDAEELPFGYEEKQLYCEGVRELKQAGQGGCGFLPSLEIFKFCLDIKPSKTATDIQNYPVNPAAGEAP